jgi:alpha-mannosidase
MTSTSAQLPASGGVVHIIGYAHLDPAWMWRWHEGFAESSGLARTALALMEEFPDYTFVRSSAQAYEWILQNDPALFSRIQRAVERGQWDIVGGWWEQPDDNIPSAESFNRQALYGQRFFLKHFGRIARVGYCPDSFGHCAALPALLKAAGMDAFVFTRPNNRVFPGGLPNLFEWVAPDGSSVIGMHSPTNSYGTWTDDMAKGLAVAMENIQSDVGHVYYPYGWSDHGGGPTRANLMQLRAIIAGNYDEAIRLGAGPESIDIVGRLRAEGKIAELRLSTYTKLLEQVLPLKQAGRLPKIDRELQYVSQGCYTSCSNIKYNLRQLENELFRAESAVVAAQRLGALGDPLKDDLDEAWKALLFNQFHDICAGTAYPPAVEDAIHHLGHGRYLADRVANRACQAIFNRIDASKKDFCHFFFNPLPWPVKRLIPIRWAPAVFDERGEPVAFQRVLPDSFVEGTNSPSVVVATIPACGGVLFYNERSARPSPEPADAPVICAGPLHEECIRLHERLSAKLADPGAAAAADQSAPTSIRATEATTARMESGVLAIGFGEDGNLRSLKLKSADAELLAGPVVPLIIDDPHDSWAGFNEGGSPHKWDNVIAPMKCSGARIVDDGPILGTVRCEYVCDDGRMWIDYRLGCGLPYLDALIEIQWHGRHRMLKLAVPTALEAPTLTFDTPLAPVVRPADGVEGPGQRWIDMTGTLGGHAMGLSIANDAKYGFSGEGSEMRPTLLRSAHMAWMRGRPPRMPPQRTAWHYMDQNVQRFWLRFYPHEGDWRAAGTQRIAMELNCPPFVVHGGKHSGELAADFSALAIEPGNVIPLAIKLPEEGKGTVLRIWESAGAATEATIHLDRRKAAVSLRPYQMKTLLLKTFGRRMTVTELDTIERPLAGSRIQPENSPADTPL